jgi:NADH-quinone oxidoreductase subunit N
VTGPLALLGVVGALNALLGGPAGAAMGLSAGGPTPHGALLSPNAAHAAYRAFGLLSLDAHAAFFRVLIIAGTGLVILHGIVFRELDDRSRGEFHPMLLGAALGGCLLVSTDHLLMLVLAMEMLSLPSYLLAGWQKKERRSSEAALKYLVYGALASGLMLFGFSLLYGLSGSLWLRDLPGVVGGAWSSGDPLLQTGVALSVLLVFAGFGFKISAFPFHFWAPDVYEGSPTPVTTLLAVASKAAGFGLLVRFVDVVFLEGARGTSHADWMARVSSIIAVLSAVTMTYGNVTAVLQRNVKRLLAYSSISHAGYLLMGLAVMTSDAAAGHRTLGIEALLFYLVTYYLATLGAFGCVMALANRFGAESTDDYRGLGWSAPWVSGALVLFLISLTGLPPTAGFVGKWMLFRAALDSGLSWLAVVAALNAVVALFYYFKLARALFLRGDTEFVAGLTNRGVVPAIAHVSIVALAAAVVWFGLMFDGLTAWVERSVL